ncbi:MAG: 30S ribosomal protein S16 [Magnetococcales bacterium]|nr:30S ribosomal protein S16 [Magnetococcales bacterium]NGZ26923.1 30S ribosomal protein S16 [Magnetococcales bacterium]
MPVKIRLQRRGSKKRPCYAVVAADATMPRDGRSLEKLGTYDPRAATEQVRLNVERVAHWLGVGAIPTDRVAKFIKEQNIQPARAAG